MNLAKKVLMSVGLVVLAAALISTLAPKATHALVATLVQISNTPSSPVPNRDVDLPDRATIQDQGCTATSFAGGNTATCSPSFTVPAGQRFVFQELEASCTAPRGNNIYGASAILVEAGFGTFHPFVLISEGDGAGQAQYAQNQQVHYYADPGSTISFFTYTTDTAGNTNCYFAASGYLINYP
jgi:hypothetical protein